MGAAPTAAHRAPHHPEEGSTLRMTTEVILTGTGVPHPRPGRAGPGELVRYGDTALQFDAGRATASRLREAGTPPHTLSAVSPTPCHRNPDVGSHNVAKTCR